MPLDKSYEQKLRRNRLIRTRAPGLPCTASIVVTLCPRTSNSCSAAVCNRCAAPPAHSCGPACTFMRPTPPVTGACQAPCHTLHTPADTNACATLCCAAAACLRVRDPMQGAPGSSCTRPHTHDKHMRPCAAISPATHQLATPDPKTRDLGPRAGRMELGRECIVLRRDLVAAHDQADARQP